jgi:hypothetical protein
VEKATVETEMLVSEGTIPPTTVEEQTNEPIISTTIQPVIVVQSSTQPGIFFF